MRVPLRVDFAGGWLDVPSRARPDSFVVNLAISPVVSAGGWPYEKCSGLGGSAAADILRGGNGVDSELDLGVGWQDPAVIRETGLCVWRSGPEPVLDFKSSGDWLTGLLALHWTGVSHDTPGLADRERNYDLISTAGDLARSAVLREDVYNLADAMLKSHRAQHEEGMEWLPALKEAVAWKYCGGGHGGYGVYLFSTPENRDSAIRSHGLIPIEPYWRLAPPPS